MNIFSNTFAISVFVSSLIIATIAIAHAYLINKRGQRSRPPHKVRRHSSNPLISPLPHRDWEANGTFNPAAIEDDDGRVHLLYRAIGHDGMSRIGHASSGDGFSFDTRSSYPVYEPARDSYETKPRKSSEPLEYDPAIYTSGGGWGGHEDPRAVKIGNRVYMTYVAFGGWENVRIALTSIAVDDLKEHRWNWRKPQLISSAKEVNKNWLIFPEKIGGKYAILHSVVPKIMIEYVDSLDYIPQPISSRRPQGSLPGRPNFWESSHGWYVAYIQEDDAGNRRILATAGPN